MKSRLPNARANANDLKGNNRSHLRENIIERSIQSFRTERFNDYPPCRHIGVVVRYPHIEMGHLFSLCKTLQLDISTYYTMIRLSRE
jgi:hypothetical protein